MINLMYIVLMALLALNVSSDVLNGFSLVDESLKRTTENASRKNASLLESMADADKQNHNKIGLWYEKARQFKLAADRLYAFIDSLKMDIAREADGKDANPDNIRKREDREAVNYIMLAPASGAGDRLQHNIEAFRDNALSLVTDPLQQQIISRNLSTEVSSPSNKSWSESLFENIPVAAALTLLSKIQSDVRYAEGEVLHQLAINTDIQDVRVNQLQAYVLPTSQHVIRGNSLKGRIVLAAVDSTQRPRIVIAGKPLPEADNGCFEVPCPQAGEYTLKGYLELSNGKNETIHREFQQDYTVVEPTATVSATLMNVLYAGYDNPLSISVPGVPRQQVSAEIINGTGNLSRTQDGFLVKPQKAGERLTIRVSAQQDGRRMSMGDYTFNVRLLPDPTPFLTYSENGEAKAYRGGTGLTKRQLLSATGITAAIDDGLIHVNFPVKSFEIVFFDGMGNAVPEVSDGPSFSKRQLDMLSRMQRNRRFYISRVRVSSPEGTERLLPTVLEVVIK